jgi:ferredoxin--NADP+ reductase
VESSETRALRERHYNATIVWMRREHDELMRLRVRPDAGIPPFRPGQYAALGLGYWERRVEDCQPEELAEGRRQQLVRRAFSISSAILDPAGERLLEPEEEDYLEFYVALVRYGEEGDEAPAFTTRLFCLEEGNRIWIGPKLTGHYTLDGLPGGSDVLFCATGTGEAPHNRMVWHLLRSGHSGRLASVVCCRLRGDLAYLSENRSLARLHPRFSYFTMTTREEPGKRRYIQDLLLSGELAERIGFPLDPNRVQVYLCGNPAMIGIPKEYGDRTVYPKVVGVIEVLETRYGFRADRRGAPGNIHFEKYW